MELRCPKCQALVHSRKTKLCGACGHDLVHDSPGSRVLAELEEEERAWSRRLADDIGGSPHVNKSPLDAFSNAPELAGLDLPLRVGSPVSTEFRKRKRTHYPLYVLAGSLPVLLSVVVAEHFRALTFQLVGIALGYVGAVAAGCWFSVAPNCPHCRANIRNCESKHCFTCGTPTLHGRCPQCELDRGQKSLIFRPYSTAFVNYCPRCGVHLDTWVCRSYAS